MRAADGAFPTPEDHEALVQRVIAAGRAAGTPTGIHTMDPHVARQRAAQGMQFLAVASDLRLMTRQAESVLQTLHPDGQQTEAADY
jgi:4-hydroxy-2-oxoheptanedioate aldolase